jgi:Exopolyphosphatase-related proteins
MQKKVDMSGLREKLEGNRNTRIAMVSHSIGDADFIGSAIALSEYMPNSKIVVQDKLSAKVEGILKDNGFPTSFQKEIGRDSDLIIMLDVNDFEGCGPLAPELSQTKKEILVIDHHFPKAASGQNMVVFDDERYSSTSNIIYRALKEIGAPLSPQAAKMLLIGIISDSAELINSTPGTFRDISEILEMTGADYAAISDEISYDIKPKERIGIIDSICSSQKEVIGGELLVHGESKLPAHMTADFAIKAGADIALFYSLYKKEISFSARMRSSVEKKYGIHLGKIMGEISGAIEGNGGGHSCAAGSYGPGQEGYKDFISEFRGQLAKKMIL